MGLFFHVHSPRPSLNSYASFFLLHIDNPFLNVVYYMGCVYYYVYDPSLLIPGLLRESFFMPSILTLSKRENLPLGVSHLDYPILEDSNLNRFGFSFQTVQRATLKTVSNSDWRGDRQIFCFVNLLQIQIESLQIHFMSIHCMCLYSTSVNLLRYGVYPKRFNLSLF